MSGFYFDTYVIIELLKGNLKYEFVKEDTIITSPMNLAELYYSLLLENGKDSADFILNKLNFEFLEITPEITIISSFFRYKHKKDISFFDAVGYTFALKKGYKFVTGDKEFKSFENVEFKQK